MQSYQISGFIHNQTTVIAQRAPNQSLLDLVALIKNSCEDQGVILRAPWGMHITTNRFSEARSASELSNFFSTMNNALSLGLSQPTTIDVSYFAIDNQNETLNTMQRFDLVQ